MHVELREWLDGPLAIYQDWLAKFTLTIEADALPKAASRSSASSGVVAVIGVRGPITSRDGVLTEYYGFTSSDWIKRTMKSLAADSSVKAIAMDFDSPGGSVGGVDEAAAAVRDASKVKPVVAVSNGMMASAAYWIGSQASEVVTTRTSLTGSIGVYIAHQDYSKAADTAGIKTTFVKAGKFKAEGNPYEPLNDEAKGHLQAIVDDAYNAFTADVAKGRGAKPETVRNGFGQGRVLTADSAVSERLADRVGTLDEVVAKLSGRQRAAAARARAIALGNL